MTSGLPSQILTAGQRIQRRILSAGVIEPFHTASGFDRFLGRRRGFLIARRFEQSGQHWPGAGLFWLPGPRFDHAVSHAGPFDSGRGILSRSLQPSGLRVPNLQPGRASASFSASPVTVRRTPVISPARSFRTFPSTPPAVVGSGPALPFDAPGPISPVTLPNVWRRTASSPDLPATTPVSTDGPHDAGSGGVRSSASHDSTQPHTMPRVALENTISPLRTQDVPVKSNSGLLEQPAEPDPMPPARSGEPPVQRRGAAGTGERLSASIPAASGAGPEIGLALPGAVARVASSAPPESSARLAFSAMEPELPLAPPLVSTPQESLGPAGQSGATDEASHPPLPLVKAAAGNPATLKRFPASAGTLAARSSPQQGSSPMDRGIAAQTSRQIVPTRFLPSHFSIRNFQPISRSYEIAPNQSLAISRISAGTLPASVDPASPRDVLSGVKSELPAGLIASAHAPAQFTVDRSTTGSAGSPQEPRTAEPIAPVVLPEQSVSAPPASLVSSTVIPSTYLPPAFRVDVARSMEADSHKTATPTETAYVSATRFKTTQFDAARFDATQSARNPSSLSTGIEPGSYNPDVRRIEASRPYSPPTPGAAIRRAQATEGNSENIMTSPIARDWRASIAREFAPPVAGFVPRGSPAAELLTLQAASFFPSLAAPHGPEMRSPLRAETAGRRRTHEGNAAARISRKTFHSIAPVAVPFIAQARPSVGGITRARYTGSELPITLSSLKSTHSRMSIDSSMSGPSSMSEASTMSAPSTSIASVSTASGMRRSVPYFKPAAAIKQALPSAARRELSKQTRPELPLVLLPSISPAANPAAPVSAGAEVRGSVPYSRAPVSLVQAPGAIFRLPESASKPVDGPPMADPSLARVAPPAAGPAHRRAGGAANPEEAAETIMRLIMDRLTVEAERRGWPQWA
jgi:hypothetical protein